MCDSFKCYLVLVSDQHFTSVVSQQFHNIVFVLSSMPVTVTRLFLSLCFN